MACGVRPTCRAAAYSSSLTSASAAGYQRRHPPALTVSFNPAKSNTAQVQSTLRQDHIAPLQSVAVSPHLTAVLSRVSPYILMFKFSHSFRYSELGVRATQFIHACCREIQKRSAIIGPEPMRQKLCHDTASGYCKVNEESFISLTGKLETRWLKSWQVPFSRNVRAVIKACKPC